VRRPSSASFFGAGLDRIVITSATVDFTSADYCESPDAGSLFMMSSPDVAGRPENIFEF